MSDQAILFVDDERHILSSLRRLLRRESYRVLTAEGGEAGLEVLAGRPVQVVVSDYRMPGMNGIEFLQRVKDDHPDTVRIVLSGFADAHLIVESINKGEVYRFVPKPWNDDELKATLRQCLDQYDILFQNRDLARRTEEQNRELQSLNSRLESMVEDRTYVLRLAQEILEHLPVGVVGISCDAEIVLVNATAREALPSLASAVPGTPIESALPGETADAITECLAGCQGERPLRLAGNGHPYEALLKPLEVRGSARGHVLVMYPRSS